MDPDWTGSGRSNRQTLLGKKLFPITTALLFVTLIQLLQWNFVVAGVSLSETSIIKSGNSTSDSASTTTTTPLPSKVMTTTINSTTTTVRNEEDEIATGSTESSIELETDRSRTHIYIGLKENSVEMPENCKKYQLQSQQPQFTASHWRKCCPEGSILTIKRTCEKLEGVKKFRPPFINATFYNDCIEDSEVINFTLDPESFLSENRSLVYDESNGDHLYILQNGSLLVVFESMLLGYDIFSDYCLEMDHQTRKFFALVWGAANETEMVSGIVLSQFYKGIALIMIVSFCCLIVTSILYVIVPRFGTLHGRSFTLHTFNLAMGYIFTAAMYFEWDGHSKMEGNSVLQYFISAAFLWQFTMCVDTLINVWYYIPRKISPIEGRYRGWIHFACYVLFSQGFAFLSIIHHHGEDSNAPVNYYMSTVDDQNHNDQWKFFGPILGVIIVCCGMFTGIYYGFRKLNQIQSLAYIIRMKLRKQKREDEIVMPFCSKEMEYVKDSARATCILFIIQSVCFISEVITFYTTNDSSMFFELINALQGVFILVLFVLMPKQTQIIRQWWAGDQGSLVVEQPQMRSPRRMEEVPLKNGDAEEGKA